LDDFSNRLKEAIAINERQRQTDLIVDIQDVDTQLYEGFFSDDDRAKTQAVRQADAKD